MKTFFENRQNPTAVDSTEGYEIMIILPYLGIVTDKIKRKLKKLFQKSLPNCKLKVISRTTFRIGNLFSFKDVFPSSIISNIIYKFKCNSCNAVYVGMTLRHHKVRICEHLGISPRTGKPVKGTCITAIRHHLSNCKSTVDDNDFTILAHGDNQRDLCIMESIMIKKLRSNLNKEQKTLPLYLF